MRFELPEGLTPREERAAIAALERHFAPEEEEPWLLAGRIEATRQGALQARRLAPNAWAASRHLPFARRGTHALRGRGDAK